MRRTVMAVAVAALGLTGAQSASAGGMVTAPASSWTGCYIGGNVGAALSHTSVVDEIDGSPIATLDASALTGGGEAGCDFQFAPQWVVGLQGMYNATGLSASASGGVLDPLVLNGSIPTVATLTGRLGYIPTPDWLIYAKGGLAWNHTDTNLTFGGAVQGTTNFDQSGFAAGAGAEWKMGPHWSLFTEYDYLGFSPTTVTLPGPNIGTVNQNVQLLLVGANLRFGGTP